MQKIKELIREVYHYEKKTEIETRYLSNVLLWFCLMVFLINLFNNSMKKNPGIYIFCLVVCVIGVWDAFHIRNAKNVELPDEVIQKPSLTEEQYKIYQTYVSRGYKIIRELQIADEVAEAVLYHRENYDGSGYLEGRSGRQIPVLSRILSVADYADRHARWGETAEEIGKKLEERKGTRFDPECAEQMRTILCEKEK